MKQKIINYFTKKQNYKALSQIKEIEEEGFFSGLDIVINELDSEVKNLINEQSIMSPGLDPLSGNLSGEIEDMKLYLNKVFVKKNLSNLLILYYFQQSQNLPQSPIDCEAFNLEDIILNAFKEINL